MKMSHTDNKIISYILPTQDLKLNTNVGQLSTLTPGLLGKKPADIILIFF